MSRNIPVKASMFIMGTGQLMQKQWVKGILYLCCFFSYIFYLVITGVQDFIGFFTLGTVRGDAWLGIEGDDSIMMLLRGLLSFVITALFIGIHKSNINDVRSCNVRLRAGSKLPGFKKACRIFCDKKFYIIALAVPVVGVLIFNILPIVFMIFIAFTNYGGDIVPPELVDWIGFDNLQKYWHYRK